MNILFAVSGIGRGHATRCHAIIQELEKRGHRIFIMSFAEGYEYFKTLYPTTKVKGPNAFNSTTKLNIPVLILQNLHLPFSIMQNIAKCKKLIIEQKIKFVVTDMEIYATEAAAELNIPCIGIFNSDPLRTAKTISKKIQLFITRKLYYTKSLSKMFVPSFTKPKDFGNVSFISPIIRRIPNKKLTKNDTTIISLGYTKFGKTAEKNIIEILKGKKEKYLIFSTTKYKNLPKNIRRKDFSHDFLDYFRSAKAIISTAGHSTITEALVFKKTGIFLSIPNHLEQERNLDFLRDNDLSLCSDKNSSKELKQILAEFDRNYKTYKKNLEKIHINPKGAKQVAEYIEKHKTN